VLYCTQPVRGIEERLKAAYFEWQARERVKAAAAAKGPAQVLEKEEDEEEVRLRMSV
jgi:hypothetical protein